MIHLHRSHPRPSRPAYPERLAVGALAAVILTGAIAAACSGDTPSPPPQSRSLEPRVIHLPVRYASPDDDPACDPSVDRLTIRLAREEQLPEGPQSFAVLADGTLVVADPLHERLVFFSGDGKFQRAVCVDWAVSEVERIGSSELRIRRAGDPAARRIDMNGQRLAPRPVESAPVAAQPVLTAERSAVLRWSTRGEAGSPQSAETPIELTDASQRLASVQVIALEPDKAYVRLESTQSSARSPTSVGVTVRRYSRAGSLEAEVPNIPIDYYIVPTTPFRVVDNVLYQLFPTDKEVQIRVWTLP